MTPAALATLHAQAITTPRPWSEAEFAALLALPGTLLLTQAGGFVLGRVVLDEAELLTIVTAPAQRRQGIGAALMAAFHRRAAAQGAVTVFLEVAAGNAPAQALYARSGYALRGRRRGYYRHPDGQAEDALILGRALGPQNG